MFICNSDIIIAHVVGWRVLQKTHGSYELQEVTNPEKWEC